ncbi:serine hydrolase domain-containing protein [Parasphingorhabdus sp.]|uniref:serine hydrolase domain-containing protein n=1 Tax=Parasphingorhabdus sp. TaxID=2709688 RepID=UPI003262F836
MTKYYKSLFVAAVGALALSTGAVAQSSGATAVEANAFPNFAEESAGEDFDPAKIEALEARMAQFVADGDTKGIATLLVKDGKVISQMKAGIRRLSDNAPITEDTIYRIYSMTKPVTGVALMALYEEGKFSLDDPVSKYIPEFENLKVVKSFDENGSNVVLEPLEAQPTMRQLMSHTAGFAYGLVGDDPANKAFRDQNILASPDMQSFIDGVAKIPLMHQPGKSWFYSASVDVQGAIVERLSGMKFGAFLKTRIFDPLGMDDTGFAVPADDYDRFSDVFGYHPVTKDFIRVPFPRVAFKPETIGMESGGGGLVSTMSDYARFCQMLANGGEFRGARILKAETVKLMRTNVLTGDQKVNIAGTLSEAVVKTLGFGLDFGIIRNDGVNGTVQGDGTYFWGGAAGTWFWIDPVHDLFFIGMIQRFGQNGPDTDFRGISRDLVYDALKND